MLYELRCYWARPGRRDELVELMESRVLPLQIAGGVDLVASFVTVDDPDGYVWIRRWESDGQRERIRQGIQDDPEWNDDLLPAVRELIDGDRTTVSTLSPTTISPLW